MKKILFTLFSVLCSIHFYCQIEIGDALYENFEYTAAVKYYNQADSLDKDAQIRLALCHFLSHNYAEAERHLEQLARDKELDPIFKYYYAICLKNNKKYSLARRHFSRLLQLDTNHVLTLLQLQSLDSLKILDTIPEIAEIAPLENLNTSLADFSPKFYENGILLCSELKFDSLKKRRNIALDYFDSTNKIEQKKLIEQLKTDLDYGLNISPRASIFFIPFINEKQLFQKDALHKIPANTIGEPTLVAENKKHSIGAFDFNPITKELYFTKIPIFNSWNPEITEHSLLYKGIIDNETHRLKNEKAIHIKQVSSIYGIGEPAISSDGSTMYFVSDMPGGEGGTDIYMVKKKDNGNWGKAENLGPTINSNRDELNPYIYDDSKLYFSSNGKPGYGGLDIFMADIFNSFDSIGNPSLLTRPINSCADDFGIAIHPINESLGIIVSNRPNGKGDDDLYLIHFTNIKPYVKGYVMSQDSLPIDQAIVRLIDENNEEIAQLKSTTQGKYRFDLEDEKEYKLMASTEGLAKEIVINTGDGWKGNERKDLFLEPATTAQGFVYDEDGNPVPNAKMELFNEKDSLILVIYADENGFYQFVLDDDEEYLVMGSKYNKIGDKYIHTSNNYNSDSISDITIYNPTAFIEGRVLDENGDSIQGAIVRLLDSSNVEIERVTSDENGYYHFDMSSNHHYRVIATTDGMVEDISIDTGKDWEGNEKKDLYLKPHPTGQGTTVDENGNPISDANISLYDNDGNRLLTIFSNESGFYQLPLLTDSINILKGNKLTLNGEITIVNDSNYNTLSSNDIVLKDANNNITSVKGLIKDENGNPVANARIDLYDENGKTIASTVSDEKGNYKIKLEKNKNYQIIATKDNLEGVENIFTGDMWNHEKMVDIVLLPGGKIAKGIVTDIDTHDPIEGVKITLFDNETNKKVVTYTSKNGDFNVKLNPNKSYSLKLEIKDYYPKTIELPTGSEVPEHIDLEHLKIEYAGYDVKSIYFNYDKFDILESSKKQLDILVEKLKENRQLKLEVRSYTDCRGADEYNIYLSRKRGKSVKNYLVNKGVFNQQIITKSLGATNFVNNCNEDDKCTEDEHRLNRRSEFEFLDSK